MMWVPSELLALRGPTSRPGQLAKLAARPVVTSFRYFVRFANFGNAASTLADERASPPAGTTMGVSNVEVSVRVVGMSEVRRFLVEFVEANALASNREDLRLVRLQVIQRACDGQRSKRGRTACANANRRTGVHRVLHVRD